MLTGSAIVYVIMAACGNADTRPPGGLTGGDGGNGNRPDAVAGNTQDGTAPVPEASRGVLDALSDPVASAMADVVQGGTRLKAHYYAGEDGSKQYTFTFYDSQRNEDCTFQAAADGTIRCLPTGATVFGYFTDAACTQMAGGVLPGCTPPKYAVSGYSSCPGSSSALQVYQLGTPFTGSNLYFQDFSQTPTACTSVQATNLSISYRLYTVGAEVPLSSFALATLVTAP